MKPASWISALVLLCFGSLLCAQPPKEFKDQDEILTKMFKAYNKTDKKAIYENWIDALKSLSDQMYDLTFKPQKEKYGDYKTHSFTKEGSVVSDDICLYRVAAEFEKSKQVKIAVNFQKVDGKWKIQQVTFDPPN